jgi:NAD(P)-dependent dehydrogenase (short-subunit alcohol dehydrogenase family)
VTPAALDVRDFAALATAVREFADSAPVHGLVHAAGGNAFTPLRQFDWRTADAILDTSLRAGLELCRLFAQKGIGSDGAAAVLVASAAAHCGQAGFAPYSAAKGALVAAARSLALELVPRRIRVNTVSPGWIPTELTRELARFYPTGEAGIAANHPLGLGTPADVAQATLFLLSDAARWITGTDLAIDGGYAAR